MTIISPLFILSGLAVLTMVLGGCDPGQASSQVTLIAGGQPTGGVVPPWPSGEPEPSGIPLPQGAPPPRTLAFAAPADSRTPETEELEVKAGDEGLSISSVTLSTLAGQDNFSITDNTCSGADLGSGQSCRIVFSFQPGGDGRSKAEVVLRSKEEKPLAVVYLDGRTTAATATPGPVITTSADTPEPSPTTGTSTPGPDPTYTGTDVPSPPATSVDPPSAPQSTVTP
ncbi:hypothetical protein [Arthrobacter globiformis]|uniref:hypothetical protein n=1 Tax=Arthrobacter globiformis TaxID=1665 RepID=UPI000B417CEA|nr:hypothetical protein [Arthrobacter globiformis]